MNHQNPGFFRRRITDRRATDPQITNSQVADDEISLVDVFLILSKRKTMIIILTLLTTAVATGISFVMPKVYEVVAILEPGKNPAGELVESPQVIRENILGGAYDQSVAEKLSLSLIDIPKFRASVPRETDLVKISIESSKPEQAVDILRELLAGITAEIQQTLNIKIQKTKNEIEAAQLENVFLDNQAKLLKEQIIQFKDIIADLGADRQKAMADSKRDSMAVLLYATEVQNKQIYLNNLQDRLERIALDKRQMELKIDNMQLLLSSFRGTKISKSPNIPEKPKKPKKTLIIVMAFMLGLMGSVMLAFLAEFITKVHQTKAAQET